MAAVGCALAYGRAGDRRWLAGAGRADGRLAGDQTDGRAGAGPDWAGDPAARPESTQGVADRLACCLAAVLLAVLAVIVLAVGPQGVYDQMIRFRVASRAGRGLEPEGELGGHLRRDGRRAAGAAGDGGIVAGAAAAGDRAGESGVPLVAWAVASLGLLLVYSPLQFKHAVILLPPLTLLIGVGAGVAWRRWDGASAGRAAARGSSRWSVLALGAWYVGQPAEDPGPGPPPGGRDARDAPGELRRRDPPAD